MILYKNISRAAVWLGALLLAWMAISTTVAVTTRALVGNPLAWTLETTEYAMLGLTLFPLANIVLAGEQIRVTLISEFKYPRLAKILDLLGTLFGIFVAGVFLLASIFVTVESYMKGALMIGVFKIPRWPITFAIAAAALMWIISESTIFVRLLKSDSLESALVEEASVEA